MSPGLEEDRPPDPHPCNPCPSLCLGCPHRSLLNRDPAFCRAQAVSFLEGRAGVQLAGLGHPQASLDLGGWKQLAAI